MTIPPACPRRVPLQCFLSAGEKQLAVYFHLPKALSESKGISLKEWATAVLAPVEGHQVGPSTRGAPPLRACSAPPAPPPPASTASPPRRAACC